MATAPGQQTIFSKSWPRAVSGLCCPQAGQSWCPPPCSPEVRSVPSCSSCPDGAPRRAPAERPNCWRRCGAAAPAWPPCAGSVISPDYSFAGGRVDSISNNFPITRAPLHVRQPFLVCVPSPLLWRSLPGRSATPQTTALSSTGPWAGLQRGLRRSGWGGVGSKAGLGLSPLLGHCPVTCEWPAGMGPQQP